MKFLSFKGKLIRKEWGFGDWGLGIGDWAQSPIPNSQTPNPHPQTINFIKKIN